MASQRHVPAPERRAMLVEATVRVMRRKGLLETTGRDVASEADTSVGLVHHYFDSHDALLVAAFEQVTLADFERVQGLVATADDSTVALRVLVHEFAPARRAWQYQVWIDAWAASAHHPELRRSSRTVNLRWVRLFGSVFTSGVASNEFTCPDPAAAGWRLLALLDGMAVQSTAGQIATSRRTLIGWVARAAETEAGLPVGTLL